MRVTVVVPCVCVCVCLWTATLVLQATTRLMNDINSFSVKRLINGDFPKTAGFELEKIAVSKLPGATH